MRAQRRVAKVRRKAAPLLPKWPSYRGTSRFVGTSPSDRVTVFVDPSLGPPGLQNARDLVDDADRVVNTNDAIFGTKGGSVGVIVFALGDATDGGGGADHLGCDFSTGAAIEVCASFGNSARVSALFEAELSECSMNGNLCGRSTGEALSRWCAAWISNNALPDFATAPLWAQDGMPNFVDRTDATDQNPDSTGCGVAFLSWLISQGHELTRIAPLMVALGDEGTLAQLYGALASDDPAKAWPSFLSAIQGLPNGVESDDPLGAMAGARHLATPRVCQPTSRRLLPPRRSAVDRTAAETSGKARSRLASNTRRAPNADGSMLNAVVDLSHYNGDVDLEVAKQDGILAVIHKATQGFVFADPLYAVNRAKARAAGLFWGAYHFGTGGDGVAQAEHFLQTAKGEARDLLVLDLEYDTQGPSMTLEEARAFVRHLHFATGRWPGLHAGYYLKELIGAQADPVLGQCWFWLAQYGPTAVVPPAWQTWTLWQYTDGAVGPEPHQVQGIGRCDRDRFHGDAGALRTFWSG
jgi:GH25 family lysozyme M1 (1,4-beta-N-acetylmuramidase)